MIDFGVYVIFAYTPPIFPEINCGCQLVGSRYEADDASGDQREPECIGSEGDDVEEGPDKVLGPIHVVDARPHMKTLTSRENQFMWRPNDYATFLR